MIRKIDDGKYMPIRLLKKVTIKGHIQEIEKGPEAQNEPRLAKKAKNIPEDFFRHVQNTVKRKQSVYQPLNDEDVIIAVNRQLLSSYFGSVFSYIRLYIPSGNVKGQGESPALKLDTEKHGQIISIYFE